MMENEDLTGDESARIGEENSVASQPIDKLREVRGLPMREIENDDAEIGSDEGGPMAVDTQIVIDDLHSDRGLLVCDGENYGDEDGARALEVANEVEIETDFSEHIADDLLMAQALQVAFDMEIAEFEEAEANSRNSNPKRRSQTTTKFGYVQFICSICGKKEVRSDLPESAAMWFVCSNKCFKKYASKQKHGKNAE